AEKGGRPARTKKGGKGGPMEMGFSPPMGSGMGGCGMPGMHPGFGMYPDHGLNYTQYDAHDNSSYMMAYAAMAAQMQQQQQYNM
ncbi:unnamed protein product, partial [Polarella glacialis]